MQPTIKRTVVAGVAGGVALNVAMLLTFRLIGFGWKGDGILMDPRVQSPKLIAVWTTAPLPRVLDEPAPLLIGLGLVVFGIVHAFFYRMVSAVWPEGAVRRGARLAMWTFVLVFAFWEFFTPFNQLHEPLPLIGLELLFWAVIAGAEGLAIAAVMEGRPQGRSLPPGTVTEAA